MALDLTDANAFRAAIRYDPLTKKGSVLDVVQLVTGTTAKHAHASWVAISQNFPEVSKIGHFNWPQK